MSYTKQSGIYVITNIVNGKMYVGSSLIIKKRLKEHFGQLRNNKHYSSYLQRSFNKHKEENFQGRILELVDDQALLTTRETYWINKLNTLDRQHGYNNSLPHEDHPLGIGEHTELTKELLREQRYEKLTGIKKKDDPKSYNEWKENIPKRNPNPKNKTRRMIAILLDGTFVGEYKSNAHCSRKLQIPVNRIQEVLVGKEYGKGKKRYSYKGYAFFYKDDYESGNFTIKHRRWDKKGE